MGKKNFLRILWVILIMLMLSSVSVSAQDIDVESMDDAQLMSLMQSIMQKLEADGTPSDQEHISENINFGKIGVMASELSVKKTEETPEKADLQIYINKKMVRERIPDSSFIPKRNPNSDTGTNDGKSNPNVTYEYWDPSEHVYPGDPPPGISTGGYVPGSSIPVYTPPEPEYYPAPVTLPDIYQYIAP